MDTLSREQQRFLENFINNKGNFYLTLNNMGLELAHIISWRSDPYFDEVYRLTSRKIIEHLKHENYLLSIVKINQILINGINEETITNSHTIDSEGVSKYTTKKVVKKQGVPVEILKMASQESSLVKAVHQLLSEGVLPTHIARKLLATAEKISDEMIDCFGDNSEQEAMTEQKAIALIKHSILGSIEEK